MAIARILQYTTPLQRCLERSQRFGYMESLLRRVCVHRLLQQALLCSLLIHYADGMTSVDVGAHLWRVLHWWREKDRPENLVSGLTIIRATLE
jgi:hypothetical protein